MTTGRAVRNCFLFVAFCSPLLPAFGQYVSDVERLERQTARQMEYMREKGAEYELLKAYNWQWWLFAAVATGLVMFNRGVMFIKDPLDAYLVSGIEFAALWVFSFPFGFLERILQGWVGPSMTTLALRNVSGWAFLICGALAYLAHLQINSRKTT